MLALVLALGATPLAVYADEVQTGISTVSEDTEEKDKDNTDESSEGKGKDNTDESSEGKDKDNTDESSEVKDKDNTDESSEVKDKDNTDESSEVKDKDNTNETPRRRTKTKRTRTPRRRTTATRMRTPMGRTTATRMMAAKRMRRKAKKKWLQRMELPRPRLSCSAAKFGTAEIRVFPKILKKPPKMPKAVTRFTWAKVTIPFMALTVREPQRAKT